MATRPQHRIANKTEEYYKQAALYYSGVCIPAVNGREVDKIFNAVNGELDMADYTYVTNPFGSKEKKYTQFPSKIRNFDILSPVLMLLMGEKRRRGLRYTVVARNSNIETQRAELEAQMTDKMLVQQLMQEFISFKQAMGEEVSPEDYQQHEQITVEKIQKESQGLQDSVAVMGQCALDYIRDYCELDRKNMEGWFYWICTGRVFTFKEPFRDEVLFEPISPKEMYYMASSSIRFMEDAEAVKRRVNIPLTEVIDKFQDTEGFEKVRKELEAQAGIGSFETFGKNTVPQGMTEQDTYERRASSVLWSKLFGEQKVYTEADGVEVEHVVWTSLKKLGLVKGTNIFNEPFEEEVDVDFEPRDGETVTWHYVQIKCHAYIIDGKHIIGGEELPYTLSEIGRPANSKNPYNGRIFNLRHTNPVGIMQKGLVYQVKYNIMHYYIEKAIAKNMDKIIILPLGLIAEDRGHTTESTMYYAQSHGFIFPDETKKNFQTAINGIKVLDAGLGSYINQMYEYLRMIKQEWKELVGITPGREGQMQNSNDGKALMENSVFRSSVMTEEWFAEFEELEQRDLQGLMELGKYAFHDGKRSMFINTDLAKVLVDVDPELFSYSDYLVRVSNSGKDLEDLQMAKAQAQAMAQNMQGKITPVLKVIRSNNISQLILEMDKAENEFDQQQQQMAQQQNEAMVQAEQIKQQIKDDELSWKYYNTDKMAATQLMTSEMSMATAGGMEDDSYDGDFDALLKNNIEREKMNNDSQVKREELRSKEKMNRETNETKKYVADKQATIARVNKN
jgi:hypothetical protein